MKKNMLFLVLKLVSTLLLTGLLPVHIVISTAVHTVQAKELMETARQWQQQLAKQQGFELWKDATLSVKALGPGTHGWIVLVKNSDDVVGYMIVYATEDGGYSLNEYGTGDAASFQFLAKHIAEFGYYGPFHSIVSFSEKNAMSYVEPFFQEALPITQQQLTEQKQAWLQAATGHGASQQPALITGSFSLPYFAPYDVMPWLTGTALNDKFEDDVSVETIMELGSQLRFTTESWNDTIFSAYSITGFHEWNEFDLFLALQGDNDTLTRYIAYDTLMKNGNFYDKTVY